VLILHDEIVRGIETSKSTGYEYFVLRAGSLPLEWFVPFCSHGIQEQRLFVALFMKSGKCSDYPLEGVEFPPWVRVSYTYEVSLRAPVVSQTTFTRSLQADDVGQRVSRTVRLPLLTHNCQLAFFDVDGSFFGSHSPAEDAVETSMGG